MEYCAGGKIEKNEMGGACGAYGEWESGAQISGGEPESRVYTWYFLRQRKSN